MYQTSPLKTSRLIKQFLPERLVQQLQCYRTLNPRERYIYAKLQCLRIWRGGRHQQQQLPTNVRCILFVCHGNVIRSPMAAALLKQSLVGTAWETLVVMSAGLDAFPGGTADPRSIRLAREFGLSLDGHRPQPLTRELVAAADVIFVMDFVNQAMLLARYPRVWHKVYLLGRWIEDLRPSHYEIRDPYHGDITNIQHCYTILQACIRELVRSYSLVR
jgi:protein-tyrosine phosphatase